MKREPTSRDRALALGGATWIAIAFAGMYAVRALPALARLPFVFLAADAVTITNTGIAVSALCLALELGIVILAIRAAGRAPERPPWLLLAITVTCAFFSYPIAIGSGFAVTTMAARQLGSEGLAQLAMSQSMVSAVDGALHVLVLLGVVIATALRWQREVDARDSDAAAPDS